MKRNNTTKIEAPVDRIKGETGHEHYLSKEEMLKYIRSSEYMAAPAFYVVVSPYDIRGFPMGLHETRGVAYLGICTWAEPRRQEYPSKYIAETRIRSWMKVVYGAYRTDNWKKINGIYLHVPREDGQTSNEWFKMFMCNSNMTIVTCGCDLEEKVSAYLKLNLPILKATCHATTELQNICREIAYPIPQGMF